jgi:hypothetical protein
MPISDNHEAQNLEFPINDEVWVGEQSASRVTFQQGRQWEVSGRVARIPQLIEGDTPCRRVPLTVEESRC